MVGNSGAIWTGAGSLKLPRSRRPFRTAYLRFILIELRYSLLSDRYARALHACYICGIGAHSQHVQRCSEQASRYNIWLSNKTGWLWWVTERNKDGTKCRCLCRTFNSLSFFLLFVYYAYPIILNDRLCRFYSFFSAALFIVLTARC